MIDEVATTDRHDRKVDAPAEAKRSPVDTGLNVLADEFATFRANEPQLTDQQAQVQFTSDTTAAAVDRGHVGIDATSRDAPGLLAALEALGLQHGAIYGNVVGGWLPVAAIDELHDLPDLLAARPSYVGGDMARIQATDQETSASDDALTQVGSVTSEADDALFARELRDTFGLSGAGVQVGILSDSFDALDGYATDIATGDLPPDVTILSDLSGGGLIDEGRAMAQLVHDLAPDADLAFHTAFVSQADFANGILELADAGADVIVDDVIYFAEPMFQDGIIAQAVDEVASQGVAYASSAGNQARRSWEGTYQPASAPNPAINPTNFPFTYQTFHDFDDGPEVDIDQEVIVPASSEVILSFQWQDPFASAGGLGAATDLDLLVYDADFNLVAEGVTSNVGGDPVEVVRVANGTARDQIFQLVIGNFDGPDPEALKWVNFGAPFSAVQAPTFSGASYGHASAEGGLGVGAADYQDTPAFGVDPPLIQPFSSAGTTPILFDTAGNPVVDERDRVDITGVDGTNTTFFTRDRADDPDTFPNFFGTSAAAPHVAALAALLIEFDPTLSPEHVYDALRAGAVDMDDPFTDGFDVGQDDVSGSGLADGFRALGAAQDWLVGTPGADVLESVAHEAVYGRSGDDVLVGGAYRDLLDGGPGNDLVSGGGKGDTVRGGQGDDVLFAGRGVEQPSSIVAGRDGDRVAIGGSAQDRLPASTVALRLTDAEPAGDISDRDNLDGGDGRDTLFGATGADVLHGGDGDDLLFGGSSDDEFDGGAGRDVLDGGPGHDVYRIADVDHSAPGMADLILAFDAPGPSLGDLIDLSSIDADTGTAGDQAFALGGPFGAGSLRALSFGEDGTLLQGNVDDDGAPELELALRGVLPGSIDEADFLL